MFEYASVPLHWCNRLSFLVRKELAGRFRAASLDVTAEEWAVLLILWRQADQSPGSIADATIRDRTTITRLIDGMVRKGLVERREDPKDRRKSVLNASQTGQDLQTVLVPMAREMIAQSQKGLNPKDVEITLRTLKAMTENLLQGKGIKPEPAKKQEE